MSFVFQVNEYLEHGANVNALTQDGEFPLYLAITKCIPSVLETLLKRGANFDLRTIEGRTALHKACKYKQTMVYIRPLVDAGADVLVEDCEGNTPLALVSDSFIGHPVIRTIIRALALKKACQPSIELKDESRIKLNPKLWDYYRDCIELIEKTKFQRFAKTCTFFELLTKCPCRIAALTRNPEFEIQFRGYDDLSEFGMYAEDIPVAFERALNRHRYILAQEEMINEAANNIFPYMIVRKVVDYLCKCRESVK